MTQIVVMPHADICPEGKTFDATPGMSLLDNLLEQGIDVEHACEKACACTTCHVIVREGFDSLSEASEDEEDLLDRAWGLTPVSRLSCQAIVADRKLVVAIIGDDRSLQQAFTRSTASADRFGRTIKSKLSVSGSFQGLLDDTRAMQKEAAGLSQKLEQVGTAGQGAAPGLLA